MHHECERALAEMVERLDRKQVVPTEIIREWMNSPCNDVRGYVFDLLFEHPERVHPPPIQEVNQFYLDHLKRSMLEDRETLYVPGRYMAAHTLRAWFQRLWQDKEREEHTLKAIRSMMADVIREGDKGVTDAIITAVLEHLFVHADIVEFFHSWRNDLYLSTVYDEAIDLTSR